MKINPDNDFNHLREKGELILNIKQMGEKQVGLPVINDFFS
ncbi:hypothetical protein [Ginsengibacter hankyongi]|nr:hypothetical protein [Ginsengibacter hankyongi]